MKANAWLAAALITVALPLLSGCGAAKMPISGSVTYDGQPVAYGAISFAPADGVGPSAGGEILDGRYTVPDITPGKKIVNIISAEKPSGPVGSGDAYDKGAEAAKAAAQIPPNAEGNNAQIEVTSGTTTLDFALKKPAGA